MSLFIDASCISVRQLFALGTFKPASVQREFCWGSKQVDQFLADLTAFVPKGPDEAYVVADDHDPERLTSIIATQAPFSDSDTSDFETSDDNNHTEDDGDDIDGPGDDAPNLTAFSNDDIPTRFAEAGQFLGSVILRPCRDGSFEIYDGLQRSTTLTALIAVIRDRVDAGALRDELHNLIAAPGGDDHYRLSFLDGSKMLRRIQPLGQAGATKQKRTRPDTVREARLFDLVTAIARELPKSQPNRARALAHFVLDRCLVMVAMIDDPRIARKAFVANNLFGVRLTRPEIFKGQLTQLADNDDQAREIIDVWSAVVKNTTAAPRIEKNAPRPGNTPAEGETHHLYNQVDDTSIKSSSDELHSFLVACDMIERREPQTSDCLGTLADHLSKLKERNRLFPWLLELRQLSEDWLYLRRVMEKPSRDPLEHWIRTLSYFKWDEWQPLALLWIRDLRNAKQKNRAKQTAIHRFRSLSRRCLAYTIAEFSDDNRRYDFSKAIAKARQRKSLEAVFGPSKTAARAPLELSRLYTKRIQDRLRLPIVDYNVRRTVMLWYEASRRLGQDLGPLRYASVEHVLPGRPGHGSRWLEDFPDPERRYVAHASIGNFGLVEIRLQEPLSNKDYAGPGGKRTIFINNAQHAKYRCMRDIPAIDEWTEAIIARHTEAAARHIWQQLALPDPLVDCDPADSPASPPSQTAR